MEDWIKKAEEIGFTHGAVLDPATLKVRGHGEGYLRIRKVYRIWT